MTWVLDSRRVVAWMRAAVASHAWKSAWFFRMCAYGCMFFFWMLQHALQSLHAGLKG
jgi:hypothetical protein